MLQSRFSFAVPVTPPVPAVFLHSFELDQVDLPRYVGELTLSSNTLPQLSFLELLSYFLSSLLFRGHASESWVISLGCNPGWRSADQSRWVLRHVEEGPCSQEPGTKRKQYWMSPGIIKSDYMESQKVTNDSSLKDDTQSAGY
jgi:hypothetical protein